MSDRAHAWRWLRARPGRGESLLFAGLVAVHLVPVWLFPYFPSQDGPSHLDNANILRVYGDPSHAVVRKYYVLNDAIVPTWLLPMLLALLMSVAPAATAEKILLSTYIVVFPLSIRYALGAIRPESRGLAILGFPFVYNLFFHLGFYGYCLSLAMFFFALGYWIRHLEHWTAGRVVILSLLFLGLYSAHLVSLLMVYIAIAGLTVWFSLVGTAGVSILWRRAVVPACACLPSLVLALLYLHRQGIVGPNTAPSSRAVRRIDFLFLLSYDWLEVWICGAVFLLLGAIALCVIGSRTPAQRLTGWDGFIALLAVYLVVYALTPDAVAGGGYVKPRLALYPFFTLLLWFGAKSFSDGVRRAMCAAVVVIAAVQLTFYSFQYRRLGEGVAEYLSGITLIEPNRTLLPLCFSSRGVTPEGRPLSIRVEPFLHVGGTIAAQRNIVNLLNYEGSFPFFPVRYRPELNPYRHLTRYETGYERGEPIDLLGYERRTGGRVDYVLLWSLRPEHLQSDSVRRILQQLDAGYDRIHVSPQRGQMQLFRRKHWSPE